MANYFIIGGDGKEYGPITEFDIRQWLGEGRLASTSQCKAESDAEFRPLEKFPEFADAFAPSAPPTIAPVKTFEAKTLGDGDYELDLGGCIVRGFELVKANGLLIGGVVVYFLIQLAFSAFGKIPIVGALFSLANFVMAGALSAGLMWLFLRVIRGEAATLGDLFAGFQRGFVQLFLGTLVSGLLIGLTMLPFIIFFAVKLIPMVKDIHLDPQNEQAMLDLVKTIFSTAFLPSLPVLLLCIIPATYLKVCWNFTIPLIIDKELDFGAAMKASWRMVNKHWWQVFGLILLVDLVNVAGLLLCCVGLILTVPIGIATLMYAYETIFSAEKE
jgi:uncharacterized membrane protein